MDNCKKHKGMFEKSLYGELKLEDDKNLELHLAGCKKCSTDYDSLSETLNLYKNTERVEPDTMFMENFWDNLKPELEKVNNSESAIEVIISKIKSWFYIQPKWSYQLAGGLSLLIMGIFIGRFFLNTNSSEVIYTNNNIANNNIVQASAIKAERYLDRSKVLLLGLVNMDTESGDVSPINLKHQKRISRELVTEASDLKKELSKPSQMRLKELISDLEVILLQIANTETEYDLSWIDLVKTGVDQRGIFLKINIQKMQNSNLESGEKDGSSVITNKNI